jgi:hypothetical protein
MNITQDVSPYSHVSELTSYHRKFQMKLEITEKSTKQQTLVSLVHEYRTHIFSFLTEDS